jgi:hypothetical protein
VQQAWEEGDSGATAITTARLKLANCQANLKWWNGKKFGNADRELKKKRKQLLELQSLIGIGFAADIKKLQDEINFILEKATFGGSSGPNKIGTSMGIRTLLSFMLGQVIEKE